MERLSQLNIKVGDKVSEGDLILILEAESEAMEKVQEKTSIEKEFKKIQEIKPEIQKTSINHSKDHRYFVSKPKSTKIC